MLSGSRTGSVRDAATVTSGSRTLTLTPPCLVCRNSRPTLRPATSVLKVGWFFFFGFFKFNFTSYCHVQHSCSFTQSWGSVLSSNDLLLRRETRIPGFAPCSFRVGIWDLCAHRRQKSYTLTACGPLQE